MSIRIRGPIRGPLRLLIYRLQSCLVIYALVVFKSSFYGCYQGMEYMHGALCSSSPKKHQDERVMAYILRTVATLQARTTMC